MEYVHVGSVPIKGQLLKDAEPIAKIGQRVGIKLEQGRPTVFCEESEEPLIVLPAAAQRASSANPSLLYDLASLCQKKRPDFMFEGEIEEIDGRDVIIRFEAFIDDCYTDTREFKCSAASARLFLNLIPLQELDGDNVFQTEPQEYRSLSYIEALRAAAGVPSTAAPESETDLYTLRSLVMSIDSKADFIANLERSRSSQRMEVEPSEVDWFNKVCFPEEAIVNIMNKLDIRSLHSLARTCRRLRNVATEVIPGLLLRLYPHQIRGVRWMLHREISPRIVPHPTLRRFCTSNGTEIWADTASGKTQVEPPEMLQDFRGGLLCDEPGLGKTITMLGLILATKDTPPVPPEGVEMTWFEVQPTFDQMNASGSGDTARSSNSPNMVKKLGFYTVSMRDASSLSKLERKESKGSGLRRSKRYVGSEPQNYGLDPYGEPYPSKKIARYCSAGNGSVAAAAAAFNAAREAEERAAAAEAQESEEAARKEIEGEGQQGIANAAFKVVENGAEPYRAAPAVAVAPIATTPFSAFNAEAAGSPSKRQKTHHNHHQNVLIDLTTCPEDLMTPFAAAKPSAAGPCAQDGVSAAPAKGSSFESIPVLIDLTTPPPRAPSMHKQSSDDSPGSSSSDTPAAAAEAPHAPPQHSRRLAMQPRRISYVESSESDASAAPSEDSYVPTDEEQGFEEDTGAAVHITPHLIHRQHWPIGDDAWLQCDLCNKWRRIPKVLQPEEDASHWCCYQHPLAGYRSCTIPEDNVAADEDVENCPGWLRKNDTACTEKNVEFFREVLSKYGYLESLLHRALAAGGARRAAAQKRHWLHQLVAIAPAELGFKGIAINHNSVRPGFGECMAELGFVPAPKTEKAQHILSFSGEGSSLNKRRVPRGQQDWLLWKCPISHWKLEFDQQALKKALELGGKSPSFRVYLSPATLLVVPPELIQHWKDQIAWHTTPGLLRVAVYDSKNNPLNDFKHPPEPYLLAYEHDIIITTLNRMSTEWNSKDPIGCSPLAQVHWHRIIVDEGHKIGSNNVTSRLQMATSLRAERRWCMTGTPSPSISAINNITLKYMQPLLFFLHDESFGSSTAFKAAVESQKDSPVVGRLRLQAALQRCMIRATKEEELRNLPRLKRTIKILDFDPSHAEGYNDFVDLVRANLLLSDWFDPDHKESFLCASNAKKAKQAFNNLHQSCSIAGNIKLQMDPTELHATLFLLADRIGVRWPGPLEFGTPFCLGDHPLAQIEDKMQNGGPCDRCGKEVRWLVVTPCACLMCVHCTAQDRTRCACCNYPYVMQSVDDPDRRRDAEGLVNPNPKWAVPKDLIEWQPARVQQGAQGEEEGYWQADWKHTKSTKVSYLIETLRKRQCLPPAGWDPKSWGDDQAAASSVWPPPPHLSKAPPKAIVFTQFDNHGRLLINQLEAAAPAMPKVCISTFHHNMTQQQKAKELRRFQTNPLCGVLVIDESGSLGLDLSFVQNIFLMEPIPDKSVELQVVSRAHRMGVKEEVLVEVLAMRGTLEEEILKRAGDVYAGASENVAHLFDDREEERLAEAGAQGSSTAAAAGGQNVSAGERQLTAERLDRNAYLKALKPVPVVRS